jgi:hypothetical protein
MSVDKNESIFIKCECQGEGMGIDYDREDKLFYFSYWSYGFSNRKMSLKERLRYSWEVLRKGKAFNDELILSENQATKLENFLLSCTRKKF